MTIVKSQTDPFYTPHLQLQEWLDSQVKHGFDFSQKMEPTKLKSYK